MINIIFCNFPEDILEKDESKLDDHIKKYLIKRNNRVICRYVQNIEEIIRGYDFYFVYIRDPKDLTKISEIKQKFAHGDIVIIADSIDYALIGYEHMCFGYLIYPIDRKHLNVLLDNMCERIKKYIITIYTPGGLERFQASSLLYANIEGRSICYHLQGGIDLHSGTLRKSFREHICKDLLLDDNFLYLEPALVVNLNHIAHIGTDENIIKLTTGEIYPVSKRQKTIIIEHVITR